MPTVNLILKKKHPSKYKYMRMIFTALPVSQLVPVNSAGQMHLVSVLFTQDPPFSQIALVQNTYSSKEIKAR